MAVSGRSCLKNVNFEPILLCLAGMVVGLLGPFGFVRAGESGGCGGSVESM